MTDVEMLLSVDAGKVPPGAVAFFERDPERAGRIVQAVFAALFAAVAIGCAFAHLGRAPIVLAALIAAVFVVRATPTLSEDDRPPSKRQVVVLTPTGVIVRDRDGLKRWTFDDLAGMEAWMYELRPHLLLIGRDGRKHLIDHLQFHRGEVLRRELRQRLEAHAT